jgi:phosphonate transport system substrate-binding protein
MKKLWTSMVALSLILLSVTGCTQSAKSSKNEQPSKRPIILAWYPNESGDDFRTTREGFADIIEQATGRPTDHILTTDYVITIEAIAQGNAHFALMGAEGYIQANKRNPKVLPLFVNSNSRSLDEAVYYSWLIVNKGRETEHQKGGSFVIDNIQGKRFSFVSSSSTSGFKVPSASIIDQFSKQSRWSTLNAETILEGGSDRFFSEVLFGGSHQGAAFNLLSERCDVASVCDVCVGHYIELVQGEHNTPGAVYRVKADAEEPFDRVRGEEFVIISSTPVLNAPFVINTEVLTKEEQQKMLAAFTAEETMNNEKIFPGKDSTHFSFYKKGERFLPVTDGWFDPIRRLSR